MPIDREVLPIDARFQRAVHRFQEVVAMRLNVESDQIRSQHAVQQFALPRANPEGFRIGPRNVPEDGHARIRPAILDHPRQQCEVIILDQHDGLVFAAHLVQQDGGELAVHGAVLLPIDAAEDRPRVRDVAERPDPLVGETKIEAGFLFLAEPDAAQRVLGMVRRHAQPAAIVGGLLVRAAGGLGDPGPVASPQHGFQRGYQAARRNRPGDGISLARVLVRFAIGDREQPASV